MSRFSYDGDDGGDYPNLDFGRWDWNVVQSLRGRRGQRTLALLEEALLAMPERRLIDSDLANPSGEVCAIGAAVAHVRAKEQGIPFADAARSLAAEDDSWEGYERAGEDDPDGYYDAGDWIRTFYPSWGWVRAEDYLAGRTVEASPWLFTVPSREPEGSEGHEPGHYFPARVSTGRLDVRSGDEEGPLRTCEVGTKTLRAPMPLVWEIGYQNDEHLGNRTPEERWERMLAWVRKHRAAAGAKA